MKSTEKSLSPEERAQLISALQARFEKNMQRHSGLTWANMLAKLESSPESLWSLREMERTGGEPDALSLDEKSGGYVFCDCAAESPAGRRNLCYDQAALEARKEFKPEDSAMHMAEVMGVELLTEEQYRALQKLGAFDLKTSSWLKTPPEIRKLGGAIFADRRYERVFVYHNGASSYYGSRGFRAMLKI